MSYGASRVSRQQGRRRASLLQSLSSGLLDASAFQDLTIQSVQLAEDRDFGYSLYASTVDGTIGINQNWQRWEHADGASRAGTPPSDVELTQLAADFVKKIGINLDPLR